MNTQYIVTISYFDEITQPEYPTAFFGPFKDITTATARADDLIECYGKYYTYEIEELLP